MDPALTAISEDYREFGEVFARQVSPIYEVLTQGVADDPEILSFLASLPQEKQQPNLLLAAVKHATGTIEGYEEFRTFVLANTETLRASMLMRRTQTNEPGRCASLLPLLARTGGPIALLEVGASAGLCLLPDRYAYEYDGRRVGPGDASVAFPCETRGPFLLPERFPEIAWRRGLDLNPLDVTDPDDVAWLRALVWTGEDDREERLAAAIRIAAEDPPRVIVGNLLDMTAEVASEAPQDAELFVIHATAMSYLDPEDRDAFVETVSGLSASWISFEGADVMPAIAARLPRSIQTPDDAFILALDGEPVALSSPHGRWLEWLA